MIFVICKFNLYGGCYVPYRYAKEMEDAEEWVRLNQDSEEHRGEYTIDVVESI